MSILCETCYDRKMKKILILCRHEERGDYDQINTFREAIENVEVKNHYEYGEYEQIVFNYDGHELHVSLDDKDLRDYDAVFMIGWFKTKMLEDVALSVAIYMDYHNIKVFNSEILYTRSRTKLSQYVIAALHDVPMTSFLFSMDSIALQKQLVAVSFCYPVIMKSVHACRGNDNYLIKNDASAVSLASTMSRDEGPWFVVQEFVPNDGDLRIVVMGERVVHIIHRQSQGDSHLNNTSKGGNATLINPDDIPQEVLSSSVALAKLLRREITGVDMIKHKETGKYYFLEINNMPQLATGTMVYEKISAMDDYFEEMTK